MSFDGLPKHHFGAILADPPWHFDVWATTYNDNINGERIRCATRSPDYKTLSDEEIISLSPLSLAADDCVLFLWTCWPMLQRSLVIIEKWGFTFKTCAFCWMKAHAKQIEMFRDDIDAIPGLGYWTRANSEPCLLATRGKPKRLNGDVRQGIIAPRREHSRKPDGVHSRIQRLVAGPYLELFARQDQPGWTVWGNETDKFAPRSEWDEMWNLPFDRPELVWGKDDEPHR